MKRSISTDNEFTRESVPFDPVQRKRLEDQGYKGYSDEELIRFGYWTRLAPAVCAFCGAVGTALASEAIIWSLGVVALFGAAMPIHPFDTFYNRFLRPLFGAGQLPHHGRPRRFACSVATLWLLVTGWMFYAGHEVAGYILGALFTLIAAIPAVIGFCVPSYIYQRMLMFWRGLKGKHVVNES